MSICEHREESVMSTAATEVTRPDDRSVEDDVGQITSRLDHVIRVLNDTSARYERCRLEGRSLAAEVLECLENENIPEGVYRRLKSAYSEYMSVDAGNFYSSP